MKEKLEVKGQTFFAPGRVNLIGEHTDYNGGHVLPCALPIGTYMTIALRTDRKIRLFSENFSALGTIEFEVQAHYTKSMDWTDYVKAVLQVLSARGFQITSGFEASVYGTIPNGAGLSSSASLVLVTLAALKSLYGFAIDPIQTVKLAQAAETEFIGVNCGMMDQFVIGMGKVGTAMLLDTHSLAYENTPLQLGIYTLVIANTNKQRSLADSKYNERFDECQEALRRIRQVDPLVPNLCALTKERFLALEPTIGDPVLVKRTRHVVLENLRTIKAHQMLKAGDLEGFGALLNDSHLSLKEDYEVTGVELDTLVSLAQAYPGVLGSRMTGAGFGGCTVTLVAKDQVDGFIQTVGAAYQQEIGYRAEFYVVPALGA